MLEHAMKDGLKPETDCGGELYSWGSNNNNLLGPQQSRESPELLDIFHKEYPNELVRQICIDQFHSVIITNSGKAFSCGHGQGGRLGLAIEKTVVSPHIINFSDTLKGETITCTQAAISRDHSMFLCSDGNVYTCGLNTYRVLGHQPPPERLLIPKQLKHFSKELRGVCAGHYHSVAWGPKALYTWGLNAGQLGHKKNNKGEEQYVVTPKIVKIINVDEINIKSVAASDGATAVCTERGDIYVLHEYLCRKIASRQLNVVQISIIGGKLDMPATYELSKKFSWDLKVTILTNTGNLLLWQESDPQLCRCIFSINRAIIIKQVMINMNEILLVTDYGEAFKGYICQRKKKIANTMDKTPKGNEKSAFHKFLEKDDCVLVQLKKISKIHRAVSIQSDSKGKDFCVIQGLPFKHFEFPDIGESEMKTHFRILLDEATETDNVHDVLFKVGDRYFPAHSFIMSTKSPYFEKLISYNNKEVIVLNDVNPDIFEQLILFNYTGFCDLTKCGEIERENLRGLCQKPNDVKDITEIEKEVPSGISAYEYYNKVKSSENQELKTKPQNTKNPVRMLHELAKRFECTELKKILTNMDMYKCTIKQKQLNYAEDGVKLGFDRSMFPNLYDVTVKCRDNKEIRAHKCILAARLEYFNNMFSIRWRGSDTSEVTLPFPKSIAEALLEFLYTDSLSYLDNIDCDHLLKVLVLADQLFVTRLKEQCELLLTNLLTLKNAVQLLSFAHLYNAEKLKYCCMKFIIFNITPFLELRSLDDLEEEVLRELSEFYFQEKEVVWCRVITPYSTAALDEEILSISNLYPISLEDEVERSSIKPSHKRKSRTHKSSLMEKNNSILIDNNISLDSVIQFPDISETNLDSKVATNIPSRLQSINKATEKIKCEDVEPVFTKLSSNRSFNSSDNSGLFYNESLDFPELNSPPSHGASFHPKTPPQKMDSKHKIVRLSQKQRKRLSSESNSAQSLPMSESPKNPWKTIPDLYCPISSPEVKFSIGDIISDEKKQKENLVKIKAKLLSFTQIEDKAIDELHKFYNSDNICDEIITIERVAIGAIASPVWVPRTK